MNLNEQPTDAEFSEQETIILDTVTTQMPELITKKGSVLRELFVRPVSYILAWLDRNWNYMRTQSSISYLKTSQLTENSVADQVASNYFVTRKTGTHSKGIITLELSSAYLQITNGATFSVNDVLLHTTKQYLIMLNPPADTDIVSYLEPTIIGASYFVNVPVEAVDEGAIELSPTTDVTVRFQSTVILSAALTSSVTGGTATETDASMIARAELNTADAGIGSYHGISKKLNKAPVSVACTAVVAGEDPNMIRARYNNLDLNTGGFVDCYVKTSNQPVEGEITTVFTQVTGQTYYESAVNAASFSGFYNVTKVTAADQRPDFTVTYGTSSGGTAEGARLSCDQTAVVRISGVTAGGSTISNCKVGVQYMPGIYELQQYMEEDANRFIGQDAKIKAAVPVHVTLSCAVKNSDLSDDMKNAVKQTIQDYINSTKTGAAVLNFSAVCDAVKTAYSDIDLVLPCVMTCRVLLKDGSYDSYYSNTGILDIRDNPTSGSWDSSVCYFYTTKSDIQFGNYL